LINLIIYGSLLETRRYHHWICIITEKSLSISAQCSTKSTTSLSPTY